MVPREFDIKFFGNMVRQFNGAMSSNLIIQIYHQSVNVALLTLPQLSLIWTQGQSPLVVQPMIIFYRTSDYLPQSHQSVLLCNPYSIESIVRISVNKYKPNAPMLIKMQV